MKVQILGTGCAKCKQLEKDVFNALAELDVAADVNKVGDISKIIGYKVMMTPALVINGKVKLSGRLPKKDELHKYINEELG